MNKTIALKGDPTRTLTLRKLFVNQFITRFNSIKRAAIRSIVINDCFGINQGPTIEGAVYSPPPQDYWKQLIKEIPSKEFQTSSNPAKIDGFMKWLHEQEAAGIYQIVNYPRVGPGISPIWTNIYISDSYKHGMLWARLNIKRNPEVMKALGLKPEDIPTDDASIAAAFNTAVHADRVGTIYTRAYNDIKGITETMDAQISRILADGLIAGDNPRKIAKEIADRISAIGIHRATLLARTEVIRAHHLASIQTYRNFGIEGVKVVAEWNTAGDDRVCELCSPLDGKVFTLDEVEGKIPVHPQCRCGVLPVILEEEEEFLRIRT